jgi:hypothetical protein
MPGPVAGRGPAVGKHCPRTPQVPELHTHNRHSNVGESSPRADAPPGTNRRPQSPTVQHEVQTQSDVTRSPTARTTATLTFRPHNWANGPITLRCPNMEKGVKGK